MCSLIVNGKKWVAHLNHLLSAYCDRRFQLYWYLRCDLLSGRYKNESRISSVYVNNIGDILIYDLDGTHS